MDPVKTAVSIYSNIYWAERRLGRMERSMTKALSKLNAEQAREYIAQTMEFDAKFRAE